MSKIHADYPADREKRLPGWEMEEDAAHPSLCVMQQLSHICNPRLHTQAILPALLQVDHNTPYPVNITRFTAGRPQL